MKNNVFCRGFTPGNFGSKKNILSPMVYFANYCYKKKITANLSNG